jgi:hypothetical protein
MTSSNPILVMDRILADLKMIENNINRQMEGLVASRKAYTE